jgi:alcohol dehydrogenase
MSVAAASIAELHFPTRVVFGHDALGQVGALARGWSERALVVTDPGMHATGLVDRLGELLRGSGVEPLVFDGVAPNPTVDHVEAGLQAGADRDVGVIVSLGGGSAHDCAKTIALVAANGGRPADYEGTDRSTHRALPLIAVNTTAGSGADVSRYAVITDPARSVKMIIADRHLIPRVALNDPLTTLGLPASQTMATGLDALTHAIEAAVSTQASPISDLYAMRAVALAGRHLPTAVADGRNQDARDGMMLASLLAGLAINSALVGAVHALAHALGALTDLPHGVCNGLFLPAVVEWNLPAAWERYADVGAAFDGRRTPSSLPGRLRAFGRRVGLPASLAGAGVSRDLFADLADRAMNDLCMTTNPRPMTRADVLRICDRLL